MGSLVLSKVDRAETGTLIRIVAEVKSKPPVFQESVGAEKPRG
jgi:hypothetical protein